MGGYELLGPYYLGAQWSRPHPNHCSCPSRCARHRLLKQQNCNNFPRTTWVQWPVFPAFFPVGSLKTNFFRVTRWKNYLYSNSAGDLLGFGIMKNVNLFAQNIGKHLKGSYLHPVVWIPLLPPKKTSSVKFKGFGLGFPVAWNGGDLSSLRWDHEGVDPSSQQMTRRGDMLGWKWGNYQGLICTHDGFP